MYFRLKLSLIERSTGESVKHSSQGYRMYFRLSLYLNGETPQGSTKYSSTGVWNVFQAVILSCLKLR